MIRQLDMSLEALIGLDNIIGGFDKANIRVDMVRNVTEKFHKIGRLQDVNVVKQVIGRFDMVRRCHFVKKSLLKS